MIRFMRSWNLSRVYSTSWSTSQIFPVEVQVLVRSGLPKFDIIGLPENVIKEGRDRILAALHYLGLELPNQKILVSLNPAQIPKEGSHFDLPILAGLLQSLGHLPLSEDRQHYFWGELKLDGKIQPPSATLSHLLAAQVSPQSIFYLPLTQDQRAHYPKYLDSTLIPLSDVHELFQAMTSIPSQKDKYEHRPFDHWKLTDLAQQFWSRLRGSPEQFLFLSLMACGRLHFILEGNPGVGKSTWCQAIQHLQLPLSAKELEERARFLSFSSTEDLERPPFENPHHSCSIQSLVGGGSREITPGAITRAHGGILFLDEILEFHRSVLDSLRQPLENKEVLIIRRGQKIQFPADIQLTASMNPCPCGFYQSKRQCICSTRKFWEYRQRLSGPLLDRFHLKAWWTYADSTPEPLEWNLKVVRDRLRQADQQPPPLLELTKARSFESPRQEIRWLDQMKTWGRWHLLTRMGNEEIERAESFFKQFQYEVIHEKTNFQLLSGDSRRIGATNIAESLGSRELPA